MSGKQLKGGMQFFLCGHMHGYNCQKMMSLEERVSTIHVHMHNKCSHYHNTGQTA